MDHPCIEAAPFDAQVQLHLAPRTPAGDDLGLGRGHIVHLALQHANGGMVVGDELRAGGTATGVGSFHFDQVNPGSPQHLAGLFADALGPAQVTGVVVGDPRFHLALGWANADLDQELADVPHFGGKDLGPLGVLGVSG